MGYKVILSPQAIEDLAAIVRRISKDDPEVAQRIGHALIDRISILENFPLLGLPYVKRPGSENLFRGPTLFSTACGPRRPAWTFSVTGTERNVTRN